MKCPYCGIDNPDIATFCGGCGRKLEVVMAPFEPDDSIPSEPDGADETVESTKTTNTTDFVDKYENVSEGRQGGGNSKFILAIILIAVAAVVAIFIIFRVTNRSSQEQDAVSDNIEETVVLEDLEEDELQEDADDVFVTDVPEEDIEDSESDIITDDVAQESTETESDTESVVLDGSKETVPYSFQMKEASATDHDGNVIVRANYDLVVLEGDDGVNQKINASLEQDCQDFLNLAYIDDDTIEAYSEDGMRSTYETDAIVVYDKKGVFSILYEVWYSNSLSSHSTVNAATYSLETGDKLDISDLTDMSDEELLDEIKTALRLADASVAYFNVSDIDLLTMDDIREEFAYIVEGGEIVIMVPAGVLAPEMAGSFKVPTTVYIKSMNYDEYTEDYIFEDSSSRQLTRDDLAGLSKEELRLARNEIFARHGRLFRDENLNRYFSSKNWYNGTLYEEDFDYNVFNGIEMANLDLLNAYDKEMGYQ